MHSTGYYFFMLNLYFKSGCPYCIRVIEANSTINAPLNFLNISEKTALRTELLEKGGKTQVPFLEDINRGVSMYESLDIIAYLKEQYGNGVEVNVKNVGNVCPID